MNRTERKKGAQDGLAARALMAPIRFYRKRISPNTQPSCRFVPTCSEYAIEAIRRHGAAKGALLAMARILRCNPLFAGGYDPVPPVGCWRAVLEFRLYSPVGLVGKHRRSVVLAKGRLVRRSYGEILSLHREVPGAAEPKHETTNSKYTENTENAKHTEQDPAPTTKP